ncbi:HAD family phosphatase [Myceligenerans sp. TRM 65318]|uniref:HAD family phosphatase n=1 Tax=Myceligenerans pegani TaxID=2776917 RepID=A0ABR9N723_9MICO|nr:HAD family phosphatase [Myceligenerans sp. TRM 65318]MBE3021113.1 HAD family phosphatase [Myceligenerans sp. TRM 65318]
MFELTRKVTSVSGNTASQYRCGVTIPPRPAPANRPRVIATDLDGTLLRTGGTVSDRSREALAAVEDEGIEVVFVTARPARALGHLADLVGGHGHVICFGGGAVWDLAADQVIESWGFADDVVGSLVAELRTTLPDVALVAERVSGPAYDPAFVSSPDFAEPGITAAHRALLVEHTLGLDPVLKLIAQSPVTEPGALQDVVGRIAHGRANLAYSGAIGLAELNPLDVTKSATLERWCDRLGVVARDVWAFGDMPVDLPMLRWAGRGIAVANAHEAVLAGADDVVGSNDEDGVAIALEKLLAEG